MRLDGRVVLVTGAARGIGQGVARAAAAAGARVVVSDLEEPVETAELVAAEGGEAMAVAADVVSRRQVEAAFDRAEATWGPVTGLVASAGIVRLEPALEITDEAHAAQFEVNVGGLLLCCQVAARRMVARGVEGAIVNVASNAGKVGYPNLASYNASKAAVISLTRSLAAEWATHGINVNAVCPGGVDTAMLHEVADWLGPRIGEEPGALHETMHPAQLGRHVRPLEVGKVVAFLLSPDANIIRGQSINIDGGDTPY